MSNEISFCETCVGGKHHKSQMPTSSGTRSEELLGLVHSDVCGKISTKSIGGAEYFLTHVVVWPFPKESCKNASDCSVHFRGFSVWKDCHCLIPRA